MILAMNIPWQDLATLASVAAAVVYLVWRLRHAGRGRRRTGCRTCPSYPESSGQEKLISSEPPNRTPYGDKTTA